MKVKISADVKGFTGGMKEAKTEVQGFKRETQGANDTVEVYQGTLSKSAMNIESFRKKMRAAKKDAQDLAGAYYQLDEAGKRSAFGKQLKAQMDQAIAKSAQFLDISKDIDRQIRSLSSDTYAFDTLKEGISTTANLFGVLASGYAAVTGDQKAYQRAVTIFTGTQQALNAMTAIQNALQKESNIYRLAENASIKISNMLRKSNTAEITKSTAGLVAETAAQTADAAATRANDAAHKALNTTMKVGPYALITAAIAALGIGIKLVSDAIEAHKEKVAAQKAEMESATKVINSYNDALKKGQVDSADEVAKITVLNAVLHDTSRSYEDRKAALDELKAAAPEYHAQLTEEGKLYNDNSEEVDKYIQHLEQVATAQAQIQATAELMRDAINKQFEFSTQQKQLADIEQKLYNANDALRGMNLETLKLSNSGFEGVRNGVEGMFWQLTLADGTVKIIDENTRNLLGTWQQMAPTVAAANAAWNTAEQKVKDMVNMLRETYKATGSTSKRTSTPKTPKTPKKQTRNEDLDTDKLIKKLEELKKKRQEAFDRGDDKSFVKYDDEINSIDKLIEKRREALKEFKIKMQPIQLADTVEKNLKLAPVIQLEPELDLSKIKKSPDKLGTLIKVNTLKQQADDLRKNFYNKLAPTDTEVENFRNGLQAIQNQIEDIKKLHPELKIDFDINANNEVGDYLNKTTEELYSFRNSLGGQAAAITEDWTKLMELFTRDGVNLQNLAGGFVLLGESMDAAGAALEQMGAGSGLAKAGMIAAAIGQITLAFAQAAAAETKSGWGWLIWMGAGLAALTTTIATISKFEHGGIVGGNSYSGDRMLARVNSGEMILNNRQQKNLFDLANKGVSNIGSQPVVMDVRLRGDDIYLSQKNKNKMRMLSGKKK